jgi:hypothetical protein
MKKAPESAFFCKTDNLTMKMNNLYFCRFNKDPDLIPSFLSHYLKVSIRIHSPLPVRPTNFFYPTQCLSELFVVTLT